MELGFQDATQTACKAAYAARCFSPDLDVLLFDSSQDKSSPNLIAERLVAASINEGRPPSVEGS